MTEAKSKPVRVATAFHSDLKSVFEADADDDVPFAMLNGLQKTLKAWSADCKSELRKKLRKLPKDHPVFCQVGLFGPMELGRHETSHTRALTWLLNPKADHGFGDRLLTALLPHVCRRPQRAAFSISRVDAERFYRNTHDDDCGRSDIWIEGCWRNGTQPSQWLILVEAKVDSEETEHQLDRYDDDLKLWRDKGYEIYKVFLTPEGRKPKTGDGHWVPLSFKILTACFLGPLRKLRRKAGYDFLRLYMAGIFRDILDLPVGNLNRQRDPYRLLGSLKGSPSKTLIEETTMPSSARALGFYITYWDQMQALYEEKDSPEHALLATLPPNAQQMVKSVGKRAGEQARIMLKACGNAMEGHFNSLNCCHAKMISRESSMEANWMVEVVLRPKRARKNARRYWEVGATIASKREDVFSLYLWLWGRGSRGQGPTEAENGIAKILRDVRVKCRSAELDWDAGTVAFAEIPLKVTRHFEIDTANASDAMDDAVRTIRSRDVEKLFAIV